MPEVIDAEVVGDTDPPGTDLAVYRPQMVLSATEATALATDLRERVMAVLRSEVDYGHIPGVKKPTLLKPGAERLLQWFGLGFEVTRSEIERGDDGKPTGVFVRCVVTKSLPDRQVTVGSAEGYASRDERKWKDAPFDTILAMAEKRAIVRATLRASATSGYFTSDMEDHAAPPPSLGNTVQVRINDLDDVGKAALREWWKSQDLPRVVDLSAEQAATVLVEIGKHAKEVSTHYADVEDDGDGGASATPPAPAAQSPDGEEEWANRRLMDAVPTPPAPPEGGKPNYTGRRAAAFAMLKAAGVTEEERKAFIRDATGGVTDSTRQLSVEQLRLIETACDERQAGRLV